MRSYTALAALAVAAAAGFAAGWWHNAAPPPPVSREILLRDLAVTVYAEPRPLPAFRMRDYRGRDVGPQQLRGRWSLLLFGYTHCPDVCPGTLSTLAGTLDRVQPVFAAHGGIQVLFVSVDPARDSTEALGAYVASFHPDFIGVTGSPARLQALLGELGGGYRLLPERAEGQYDVEHTAVVFIVDPQGRVQGYLANPLTAEGVVSRLELVEQLYDRARGKD